MFSTTCVGPTSPLGECVVCGIKSTTRCSRCAQGGIDWMYFCSIEHQKLVWPVHKRVCGSAFKWPLLRPKERDEIIDLSTKSFRIDPDDLEVGRRKRWIDSYEGAAIDAGYDAETIFKAATEAMETNDSFGSDQQRVLQCHRSNAFETRMLSHPFLDRKPNPREFYELIEKDPFGFLALVEIRHLKNIKDCYDTSWYSDLQHRLVVLVANLIVFQRSLGPSENSSLAQQSLNTLFHTIIQVTKLAYDTVSITHPDEAKSINDTFIPSLFKVCGIEMDGIETLTERIAEARQNGQHIFKMVTTTPARE